VADYQLPPGTWSHRAEVKTSGMPPYKRMHNVVYMLNRGVHRSVVVEVDGREPKGLGLMEDVFGVNWACNSRFNGGKVYVIRLNVDPYKCRDAFMWDVPLEQHLQWLLYVPRMYRQESVECGRVRLHYLFHSWDRLECFRDCREACTVFEVWRGTWRVVSG